MKISRNIFNVVLFTLLFKCFSLSAFAQITIWANSGEDKVTRDELRATTSSTAVINSIWNGSKITIFGAKNEVVAFNLVLESPTSAASNVTVAFNSLSGPGGSTITSTAATGNGVFNWVNRNIELFYVRYLEIKGVSTDIFFSGFNYDERHIPERLRRPWTGEGDGTGTWEDRPDHNKFYPDIAVPLELVNKFNITAGQNQSIWVDIYIPKTAPTGLFTGTIVISENGVQIAEVPAELTVKNFSLPDLPTARTMLAYSHENINERYLGNSYPEADTPEYTQSLALIDTHFQLAHRHRISLINSYTEIERMDDAWTSRLTGSLFTSQMGYAGPGVGVGNNVYSIGTYSSWTWSDGTKADMWTNTNAWVDWFDSQAFTTPTDYFLYLIDESFEFDQTEQWAQWINSNPGPGKRLMSLATLGLPDAVNSTPSLDIPTAWVQMAITDQWQNAANSIKADPNKRLYLYNGGRPGSGTFAIEDEGISPRVIAWTHYKMKADRWFYWESTYYNNYQAGEGETNVFQKAQTYGYLDRMDESLGETGWNYLNGDGVLFYPGTDTQYPGDSYGVNGPFASLRLKHWRRGLQDFEYLTMAAAINPEQVSQIVNKMVPKVAWEVSVSDPEDPTWAETDISWSTESEVWEKARKDLADIITRGSKNDTLTKLYFPHIASNSTWETEICVINTSAVQSLSGDLKAYNNSGQEVSSTAVMLTAHARRQIVVGDELPNPSGIGYIIFESDSENACGYTKFYIEGTYRVAIPAVSDINAGDIYMSHIASNTSWWTGVSLLNTTSSSKELTVEFDNGTTKPITIAAKEHQAFTINSLFGGVLQPNINSAVIKNGSGIVGLELFGSSDSSGDNYLSGILLKDNTTTHIYYPHIASNSTWWTGIVAYNPSITSCNLNITPFRDDGTSLTPQTIFLAGQEKYIGTVQSLNFPDGTAWFRIVATSPITGFELFGTNDGNQLGGYTGVGISGTDGVFAKTEKDGWTGIAFVNIESSPATVTMTAYDDSGNVIATESLNINAYEKVVNVASNLFSQDISNATYISYSSSGEVVGFQLNGSSDNMMLDALPGM
ncbi:MAG: hypothetical protein SRB2_00347 [Desulfobacteraceae bacterium Eth-SRB2]|nr:MAG: hypothetical protein SRB2_00347 [Desulfobacteraceae bacterium Eth-SRB2]